MAKVEADQKKNQVDNNLCLTNETTYRLWPLRNWSSNLCDFYLGKTRLWLFKNYLRLFFLVGVFWGESITGFSCSKYSFRNRLRLYSQTARTTYPANIHVFFSPGLSPLVKSADQPEMPTKKAPTNPIKKMPKDKNKCILPISFELIPFTELCQSKSVSDELAQNRLIYDLWVCNLDFKPSYWDIGFL